MENKKIKELGVVYTPDSMVQHMIAMMRPTLDDVILEPSCGHGQFVFGILDYMRDQYQLTSHDLYLFFRKNMIAIDIQQDTIHELKQLIVDYFYDISDVQTDNLIVLDALTYPFNTAITKVIGNPPYIRYQNLDESYRDFIKKNFTSCTKGNYDIYYAFIEKYMQYPEMNFIVPNSWLHNKSADVLKNKLLQHLKTLYDFKSEQIFEDVGTYTSVIHTTAAINNGSIDYGNSIRDTLISITNASLQTVKTSKRIALSGIATLLDKFYINPPDEIEDALLKPYLKISKNKMGKILFPYENGKIIDENVLSTRYPMCYSYIIKHQSALRNRDKGKIDKYESFYAFGRKQGFHNITEGDYIAIPTMISATCLPYTVSLSENTLFSHGFLLPYQSDIYALFQKHFLSFAEKHGKEMPGKNHKFYTVGTQTISLFMEQYNEQK